MGFEQHQNSENSRVRNCLWGFDKGVAVRLRDSIAVGAAILAVVRGVRGGPGLVVKGAVKTLGNAVLGKNVGVEEALKKLSVIEQTADIFGTYASHELAVCGRMTFVVGCLDSACRGAGRRSVALTLAEWKVLVPHVGVVALGIERCVDCASEFGRTVVTCDGRGWGVLIVGYRMDQQKPNYLTQLYVPFDATTTTSKESRNWPVLVACAGATGAPQRVHL